MQCEAWSKVSVRAAVTLAFSYREAELAIVAMDAGDDRDFAAFFDALGNELDKNIVVGLSHDARNGSVDLVVLDGVALEVTGDLLDAYDRLRSSRGRWRPPELRETVMALFRLRERLMDKPKSLPADAPDLPAVWLQWPLDRFPIPNATVTKLKRNDFYTLDHLFGQSTTHVAGLLGMTERQVDKLDEIIWGYLKATTEIEQQMEELFVEKLSEAAGVRLRMKLPRISGMATKASWRSCATAVLGGATMVYHKELSLISRLIEWESQPIPWEEIFKTLDYDLEEAKHLLMRFQLAGVKSVSDLVRSDDELLKALSSSYWIRRAVDDYCGELLSSGDLYHVRYLVEAIESPARFQLIRKVPGRY